MISEPRRVEVETGADGQTLLDYMDCRDRVSCIMGPLGSGKTFASCQRLFEQMCEQQANEDGLRKTRWFAIRNTYPDLMSTTIRDWLELFGDLGKYTSSFPPTHKIDFDLEDGTTVISEVIFLALDNEDAVKKLRGAQATGFWLNEMKELPKSVVDMADLRHGRYPSAMEGGPTWHGMIGDTNAPDEDHWYYHMAEVDKPDGWRFFKQPGGVRPIVGKKDHLNRQMFELNPLAENVTNLPEGYYVRGMAGKSEDWIKVNLANEYGFVTDGKPVYPEFAYSAHVANQPLDVDPRRTVFVGIDFGRTPAAVFGQQSMTGVWTILSELVTFNMGAVRFAELLKQHVSLRYPNCQLSIWGDPAGDQMAQTRDETPFMIMRNNGVDAHPTHTNDPIIRREAVVSPMTRLVDGVPGMIVSPDCKFLVKALSGGYQYRRMKVVGKEVFADKPDKNEYSHVADAHQYMMVGGGEGRAVVSGNSEWHEPVHYDTSFEFD